jgi:hypothetical protein
LLNNVKLLYDNGNSLNVNIVPTKTLIISSAVDNLSARQIPLNIPSIINTDKKNLVGLFIYAYNNVQISTNDNTLDIVYLKKVK